MIELTDKAIELIKQSKEAQNIKDEVGVRLTAMGEGNFGPSYDIRFDLPSDTDSKFGPEGAQLYVAPATLGIMEGATFDVAETPEGLAFKIVNPNYVKEVSSSGGCGGCGSHGSSGGGCGSHSHSDDEGVGGGCCSTKSSSSGGGCCGH